MAITQDSFGNTFAGNFANGDTWEVNDLLITLRTALGSNDRANISKNTNSWFRIAWRPNIVEETLTGVISVPSLDYIAAYSSGITTNARMEFSLYDRTDSLQKSPFLLANGVMDPVSHNILSPSFGNVQYWAVATSSSISFFVFESVNSYCFLSTGVFKNASFNYPNNKYGFYSYKYTQIAQTIANSHNAIILPIVTSTSAANYAHIKKRDSLPTNSEVELYLRRESDNFPLGYIPNVFKWKVDGNETAPVIGDTVRLNMANATEDYAGQGNIFCKVVGRLGNATEFDMEGDYILMRVAS